MSSHGSTPSIGPLPERKTNWSAFATSLVAQAIGVILLTQLGLIHPQKIVQTKKYSVVPLVSAPLEGYAQTQLRVAPPIRRFVAPVAEATLSIPRELFPEVKPEVRRPEPTTPEAQPEIARPEPKQASAPKVTKEQKPEVKLGVFASNAARAVNRPARTVQTGGFGDPDSARGEGQRGRHALMASAGAFELPRGNGYGSGTGGANGIRGTVVETSFGSSGASASPAVRGRGSIQQGGFSDARETDQPKRGPKAAASAATVPAEILSKPNPAYTEEARQLRIEGGVILQVRFGADGELQVIRVMRGLGHGLDQSAVQAARNIKFKPAKQDGAAVDSIAALHVVFQLAY